MWSYIGVTGFTCIQEVAWMTEALDGAYGMFGVLTTPEIISGQAPHKGRYAQKEDVQSIFGAMPTRALRCLHYCPRNSQLTRDEVTAAVNIVAPYCNAIQINFVEWPSRETIWDLKRGGPIEDLAMVFQLGPNMITTPEETIDHLRLYVDVIDYVIIDQSAGHGKMIDRAVSLKIAQLIHEADMDVGIVFAGGLSAETLPAISDLVREFDASIDAESRLLADDNRLCYESLIEYVDIAKKIKKEVWKT